jgi:hypothetical protein
MVTQSTIFGVIIFNYQVVIITITKRVSRRFESIVTFVHSKQASPISEGVTEIRINSHLAREIT